MRKCCCLYANQCAGISLLIGTFFPILWLICEGLLPGFLFYETKQFWSFAFAAIFLLTFICLYPLIINRGYKCLQWAELLLILVITLNLIPWVAYLIVGMIKPIRLLTTLLFSINEVNAIFLIIVVTKMKKSVRPHSKPPKEIAPNKKESPFDSTIEKCFNARLGSYYKLKEIQSFVLLYEKFEEQNNQLPANNEVNISLVNAVDVDVVKKFISEQTFLSDVEAEEHWKIEKARLFQFRAIYDKSIFTKSGIVLSKYHRSYTTTNYETRTTSNGGTVSVPVYHTTYYTDYAAYNNDLKNAQEAVEKAENGLIEEENAIKRRLTTAELQYMQISVIYDQCIFALPELETKFKKQYDLLTKL